MKGIYEDVVQPSPLVLFSSLPVSAPFDQASLSIDSELTSDSFIALLEDSTNQIVENSSKPLIYYHPSYTPSSSELNRPTKLLGGRDEVTWPIRSIVLHIQSPNCKKTFIRFPPFDKGSPSDQKPNPPVLGIKLPYLHFQIKPLDHTFMLQVGVRDRDGNRILIRASTFQTETRWYTDSKSSDTKAGPPKLIHLPLVFPSSENNSETKWSDLLLPLDSLIPTRFDSVDYIHVHASVRLRRIYFTSDGKQASSVDSNSKPQDRFDAGSTFYDQQVVTANQGSNQDLRSANSVFQPELTLFRGVRKAQN
ncbi:hypothetical protein MJO28_007697 [Puccinia striiformis f. sp. tritici]|uniref:Uncharacterized protein n=1 Tax=Puccinia striiformis f. sp. tritici TaxID=168172 RepID=A0ACC0EGU5_9BASI|nr:hypothetical protein MJO28_007697 [Puccinia striiformis f. sp. tritici]